MRTLMMSAVLGLMALSGPSPAAEITVLASGAIREAYVELVPPFEAATGHKVTTTWSSTVLTKQRIAAGDVFDLVIVGAPEIEAFIAAGRIARGSRVDLMKVGVGVAVKAGAPRPDIGSADAVKRALLAATSVAYSTGPSGVYVQQLFERLGIADQMKAVARQTTPGTPVARYVARGEAELGFQQVSELIHEAGIDYLGPLPPEIQNVTTFSSGVHARADNPDAARALQVHLSAPIAAVVIRRHGMEPGGS